MGIRYTVILLFCLLLTITRKYGFLIRKLQLSSIADCCYLCISATIVGGK